MHFPFTRQRCNLPFEELSIHSQVNVKFTEEDVKTELKRLQDERSKKMGEEKEKREEKRKEIVKKERVRYH